MSMIPMDQQGGAPMPAGPMDPMAGPAAPPPAPPGMPGGDPMMDAPEPQPEELAMVLGNQIAMRAEQAHAMIEQQKSAELEGVLGMIAQAAQGAQIMGPGQIA